MGDELSRLLVHGFIKVIQHPEWIAILVRVPKKNRKRMMCVGYTSLNKACSKDPFPLPQIDQVIDPTAGCRPAHHHVDYPLRLFLLCENAIWTE
jgi:hypothetical protein